MRARPTLLLVAAAVSACTAPEHAPPPPASPEPAQAAAAPAPVSGPPATSAAAPATSAVAAPLPPMGAMPGRTMPGFRIAVRRPGAADGKTDSVDSRGGKGTTLWIVNSTSCGYCNSYAERMKAIETAYMPKGVDVVHVYPVRAETNEEKVAYHESRGFRGGQVLDSDSSIARGLVVDKTPTVFVTDARGVILYRGAIDSSTDDPAGAKKYLVEALDAVLAGKPVPTEQTEPEG